MLREIDLIRILMSYHPEWEKNPEAFLELTILISSIDCRCLESGEVDFEQIMGPKLDNVAKVLMSITNVQLSPYKDFADLKKNGHPTTFLSECLVEVLEKVHGEVPATVGPDARNEGEVFCLEDHFHDRESEKLFLKLWPYISPIED
ncbi:MULTISPECIES: hypothetical protein [Olivibacter]|jgi:hypothetical protein|uniref:Uncharacterized protein n=3 Tax=Sphingobacteriaceae TaxID=84566 RepID=F4C941_SPHS2|nr:MULTISPECIES: hypothetical protein [Olivibacter]MCL4637398.1 hypothetical protein [Olivibacter sp. UJ_SKK_5.1]MDM8177954.1 hypothetical protein [Olivibacter sp. 47]MDX3917122.1 hypothetical protein [Pseudosphingobacterium sp.]QEK99261.1 hypothetical protein FKG96_00115 [Olivibacter sp. LS-1]